MYGEFFLKWLPDYSWNYSLRYMQRIRWIEVVVVALTVHIPKSLWQIHDPRTKRVFKCFAQFQMLNKHVSNDQQAFKKNHYSLERLTKVKFLKKRNRLIQILDLTLNSLCFFIRAYSKKKGHSLILKLEQKTLRLPNLK
jgi:hypothetical protein